MWQAILYAMLGICLSAAVLHILIGLRRPLDPVHLLLAAMAFLGGLYAMAKVGAYHAASPSALVAMRRWEISAGVLLLAILPWLVDRYLGRPRPGFAPALSAGFVVVVVANLVLPFGVSFVEMPVLDHQVLPWGESLTDVRVHRRGPWHYAMWAGILLAFGYGIEASVRQFRRRRRRALTLGLALGTFFVCASVNQLVNQGWVNLPHMAEIGFLALILVMSQSLISELAQGELRMRVVLDQVPAALYAKGAGGRYMWANRHFELLTGAPTRPVTGMTDLDLFPDSTAQRLRLNDDVVLESGQPCRYEETVGSRTFESLKFPLLDSDGGPYGLGVVSLDITDQKNAEHEMRLLRQQVWYADRVARLGMLNASIAHELNQPLAAMLANSQAGLRFLAAGPLDADEARRIFEDIARDSKRAGGVIAGVRALVRRQQTPRVTVELAGMVEEVLELVHSELTERNVEVQTDLAPECRVIADKGQIQQVVINLAMNAIEAMREEPEREAKLRVLVAREGASDVRVVVRDSGPGVPEAAMPKLFEAFNTSKPHGLGMGLSICASIIESHGGSIRAERNSDRGMTFSFTLPLAPSQESI